MQATAANSVGVKTPPKMPPRMMKTVSSPQNAWIAILPACCGADALALRIIVAAGDDEHEPHQRQPEQKTRDGAGEKKVADRDEAAGGERIDDGVVRRRDQQRLQRAGDGHVDGEEPRITVLDHLRDHHRADRGGIGDRRSGDAAEEGRGEDVDQRQPAADPADEDFCEIDEPLRHAAFAHDRAGEDEEGDGEKREIVGAVGDFQHHRFERQIDPKRGADRGEPERIGDRHAEQAEDREAADQEENVHARSALFHARRG